jgi:hypothetical protein
MKVTASIDQPAPASGLGYWPAFWMLGAGFRASGAGTSGTMNCPKWPSIGEIDVLEDVNALSEHSGTLHCGTAPGGPCHEFTGLGSGLQPCPGCQSAYHTYSVSVNRTNISSESITWYLDGAGTLPERSTTMIHWAMIDNMSRRLNGESTSPGEKRSICKGTPTRQTIIYPDQMPSQGATYGLTKGGCPPPQSG